MKTLGGDAGEGEGGVDLQFGLVFAQTHFVFDAAGERNQTTLRTGADILQTPASYNP